MLRLLRRGVRRIVYLDNRSNVLPAKSGRGEDHDSEQDTQNSLHSLASFLLFRNVSF